MTERIRASFQDGAVPVSGWFVTSRHPLVQQCFYAALDCTGNVCWTDDPAQAEQFPIRKDAENFAALACPDEDWMVAR